MAEPQLQSLQLRIATLNSTRQGGFWVIANERKGIGLLKQSLLACSEDHAALSAAALLLSCDMITNGRIQQAATARSVDNDSSGSGSATGPSFVRPAPPRRNNRDSQHHRTARSISCGMKSGRYWYWYRHRLPNQEKPSQVAYHGQGGDGRTGSSRSTRTWLVDGGLHG